MDKTQGMGKVVSRALKYLGATKPKPANQSDDRKEQHLKGQKISCGEDGNFSEGVERKQVFVSCCYAGSFGRYGELKVLASLGSRQAWKA